MTPFKCGTVTCRNWFQVLAPSMRAARNNPSGTVCNPAVSMTMTNGNSFQTLTAINVGMT